MTKNAPAAPGSPGVLPMGQLQARQNRNPNSRWDLSDNGEVRMHGGGGLNPDMPGPDGGHVPYGLGGIRPPVKKPYAPVGSY